MHLRDRSSNIFDKSAAVQTQRSDGRAAESRPERDTKQNVAPDIRVDGSILANQPRRSVFRVSLTVNRTSTIHKVQSYKKSRKNYFLVTDADSWRTSIMYDSEGILLP